ncbi:hypothetical protein OG488_38555 [Streptomyces sp. NBC_01460]|uniref:hypothetical protein n=1 Tax=Streptomyces sp. NBC_01460 TaxID=2903875 RepID=UPI002E31EB6B|nr:hypothetical protein [Streptomyces sp. NBC_01460]
MASPIPQDRLVPAEHALVVIDMKEYSKFPEAKMAPVRSDVDDILATVLAECGLKDPREEANAFKDRGDGAILVFPAPYLARLVDPLLGRLNAALTRYDQQRLSSAPAVYLRASVHVGPLSLPDHRGDAINDACRLVDSQEVRGALAAAVEGGAFLAVALSETAYRRTVRAGRTPGLDRQHFLETLAHVSDKPHFTEPCRLHVPGLTGKAVLPHLVEAPPPASQPASAPIAAPAAGSGGIFQFHEQVVDSTIANHIGKLRIDRRPR